MGRTAFKINEIIILKWVQTIISLYILFSIIIYYFLHCSEEYFLNVINMGNMLIVINEMGCMRRWRDRYMNVSLSRAMATRRERELEIRWERERELEIRRQRERERELEIRRVRERELEIRRVRERVGNKKREVVIEMKERHVWMTGVLQRKVEKR